MKLDVEANTNPITPGAIAPKAFSFASGGGGGGGGGTTNIYASGVNALGLQDLVPVVIPVGPGEVNLGEFPMNFVGGKYALNTVFASLTGAGLSYKFRVYHNGVLVSETTGASVANLSWGFLPNTLTPAGLLPVKVTVENTGAVPFTVNQRAITVMEFI